MNASGKIIIFAALLPASIATAQTQIIQQGNVLIQDDPATASVTEGNLRVEGAVSIGAAVVSGANSIVSGNSETTVLSDYSICFGEGNSLNSDYSFMVGKNNELESGTYNFVLGNSTLGSENNYSFRMGDNISQSNSSYSMAFGSNVEMAHSDYSMAFGSGASVMYAESSFAIGKNAIVNFIVTLSETEYPQSGIGAFAMGNGARIDFSNNSYAIGENAYVNGLTADPVNSEGNYDQTLVSMLGNSYAIGKSAKVLKAANAYAIGAYATSECFGQITLGSYNLNEFPTASKTQWNGGDPLLVVGNGTSETERSNALVVLKNGNTKINGKLKIKSPGGGISMGIFGESTGESSESQ